jgi:hypothetical protein
MKYLTRQHKQGSRTYWDMHSLYPQIQTANYWKSKTLRALKRNRLSPVIYKAWYYGFLWNSSKTTMCFKAHITGSTSALHLYIKFHPGCWIAFRWNLISADQTSQFWNVTAAHNTANNQNNVMNRFSCFILYFHYKLHLGQEIQKCNLDQFPSFLGVIILHCTYPGNHNNQAFCYSKFRNCQKMWK